MQSVSITTASFQAGHGIVLEHFMSAKCYIKHEHKIKVALISIAIFLVADDYRLDITG
ncbi:MAG: hypothetical protein ACLFQA_11080 [Bacteroidales bacterium]